MTLSAESGSPIVTSWQLEFARLVAFPAEPPLFLNQNWWEVVAGALPDDFVSTRKKHLHEEKGTFQGMFLTLSVDLNRVMWLIQPSGEIDEAGTLPTLGPFRQKCAWFVELLTPWITHQCPPLVRLAFIGKLLILPSTYQETYELLRDHLHLPHEMFAPNPPNDFNLLINRRKRSSVVTGLEINRISAWSKLNIAFSGPSPKNGSKWPDRCYAAVELDINTAPERADALPHESLPLLLKELASLGTEIAEGGDIR